MKHIKRSVKAHLDRNGVVIYRLVQGQARPKTMHVFGYGTRHKIWLKVDGLGTSVTSMAAVSPRLVKETIANWMK